MKRFRCSICGKFVGKKDLQTGAAKISGPDDPAEDTGYECCHTACLEKELTAS